MTYMEAIWLVGERGENVYYVASSSKIYNFLALHIMLNTSPSTTRNLSQHTLSFSYQYDVP